MLLFRVTLVLFAARLAPAASVGKLGNARRVPLARCDPSIVVVDSIRCCSFVCNISVMSAHTRFSMITEFRCDDSSACELFPFRNSTPSIDDGVTAIVYAASISLLR